MAKLISTLLTASLTALSLILSACQIAPPQPPQQDVAPPAYDYTQPVPEGERMGQDWFDGSAIIGHSLMEGFELYAQVDADIHYFTNTGISAAGSTSYSKFDLPDGGTGTLAQGLQQRQFSKILIMLGVNEISSSSDGYRSNMKRLVDLVREHQGQSVPIYLISLTPTTQKKSDSSAFNRSNTLRLNQVLQELCAQEKCYYLDLYACFADENGYLPADKSTDGVHLKAAQYQVMAEYIQSHTAGVA